MKLDGNIKRTMKTSLSQVESVNGQLSRNLDAEKTDNKFKMKKTVVYLSIVAIACVMGLSSCLFDDDDFGSEMTDVDIKGETEVFRGNADSINYQIIITEEGFNSAMDSLNKRKTVGYLLPAQYSMRGGKNGELPGAHAYQYQFSLTIDNYAGYMCLPQNFDGRMVSTYYDSQDFNGGAMGSFLQVKNNIVPLLNHPQIDSIPEIKAIALMIYNYSAQEVTDIYGPFPYADYKNNIQTSPFTYDPVEDIYKKIVSNIDTIVACLEHFETRPDWYKSAVEGFFLYQPLDFGANLYNRDIKHWIKFANSLKLRMAMHITKVDPVLARTWAEEAVASGVVETPDDQFKLSPLDIGFSHPLATISNLWNDTRLNASFESIMKSLDHPFLEFAFNKNQNRIFNKQDETRFLKEDSMIIGLRSGIRMLEGQAYDVNFRSAYSRVDQQNISLTPLYLMKLSEVLFLRAEGALRGWNMGGSALSFYEEGIKMAYSGEEFNDEYQNKVDNYMSQAQAVDFVYEDPFNERYNYPSLTKIGVRWNEGEDDETKLEKIITQKYIAGFPYSFEAWTDIRRTGYPKIFPVLHDDGDGSIDAGDIIRRIPFPGEGDPATQADIASSGLDALGGADVQGTRLWWDQTSSNF